MISAPVKRTSSGISPFTVACVPTGMKAGVCTAPCGVTISPRRALPSVAIRRKENLSGIPELLHYLRSAHHGGNQMLDGGRADLLHRAVQLLAHQFKHALD